MGTGTRGTQGDTGTEPWVPGMGPCWGFPWWPWVGAGGGWVRRCALRGERLGSAG